jgi:HD superfamily phosphodiesterase
MSKNNKIKIKIEIKNSLYKSLYNITHTYDIMVSLNELFTFVLSMSAKYNIDTSHSESHSMDVMHFADAIYTSERDMFPQLNKQTNVIYTSAILHDMCDKKYMNQQEGAKEIEQFLKNKLTPEEIYYSMQIMETMSYSTVKKNGYPDLGEYQMAYHIVREADLLSSYDFDRAIVYHMNRGNNLINSYRNSLEIFHDRVFNYNTDKLLISDYSQKMSGHLTLTALKRIGSWSRIVTRMK